MAQVKLAKTRFVVFMTNGHCPLLTGQQDLLFLLLFQPQDEQTARPPTQPAWLPSVSLTLTTQVPSALGASHPHLV